MATETASAIATATAQATGGDILGVAGLLVAIISGLAALVAARATLATVREMVEQRRLSYRPELLFSPSWAIATSMDGRYFEWLAPRKTVEGSSSDAQLWPGLRLSNVGRGSAKDIHIDWSVDLDETIALLNGLAEEHETGISVEYRRGTGELSISHGGTVDEMHFVPLQSHDEHPYLVTYEAQDESLFVSPPPYIRRLCELALAIQAGTGEYSLLDVTMTLQFSDLGGDRHSVEYELVAAPGEIEIEKGTSSGARSIEVYVQLRERGLTPASSGRRKD